MSEEYNGAQRTINKKGQDSTIENILDYSEYLSKLIVER